MKRNRWLLKEYLNDLNKNEDITKVRLVSNLYFTPKLYTLLRFLRLNLTHVKLKLLPF